MQSLCLDVQVVDDNGEVIDLTQDYDSGSQEPSNEVMDEFAPIINDAGTAEGYSDRSLEEDSAMAYVDEEDGGFVPSVGDDEDYGFGDDDYTDDAIGDILESFQESEDLDDE